MSIKYVDERFDQLFKGLTEFDELMDKLRRVKNGLVSAIQEAWKRSGQTNLAAHQDLVVEVPIGEVNRTRVRLIFDKENFGNEKKFRLVVMHVLDGAGNLIPESEITILGLQFLMMNPSPVIDAAAQFCDKLGCLETFKGRIARFSPSMTYKL